MIDIAAVRGMRTGDSLKFRYKAFQDVEIGRIKVTPFEDGSVSIFRFDTGVQFNIFSSSQKLILRGMLSLDELVAVQ